MISAKHAAGRRGATMRNKFKILMLAGAMAAGVLGAANPAQAQVRAMLPMAAEVEQGAPTDADGTYVVSTLDKRITIENGRAFVVDPWTHGLIFNVERGMVTLQNFRQTGPDRFEADDLPMMGKVVFYRQPNGALQGVVQGAFGEAKYILVPTSYASAPIDDDPGLGAPPPPPVVQSPRVYRLYLSGSGCSGTSLLRKRYIGRMSIRVTDRDGKKITSKHRNYAVQCKRGGKRTQNFVYHNNGPGALEFTVPPGGDGVSNLQLTGVITDVLGIIDVGQDVPDLFGKARELGRDLNVGETVVDQHDIKNGKTTLYFNITLERTK